MFLRKISRDFVCFSHSNPIRAGQKESPSPFTRGYGQRKGRRQIRGGAQDTKAHPSFDLVLEMNPNTYAFAFLRLIFFLSDFVQTKVWYIDISTRFYFFLVYLYVIRYGSLSQFVLQHHTGEGLGWSRVEKRGS